MTLFTIVYRTIFMFVIILAAMRLMGKRQMGELQLSELVVAVMISELAVAPITDIQEPLLHGIVPVAVLLACELGIAFFLMKNMKLRRFVIGVPSIIIQNGQIVQQQMRKNRLTLDELTEELRIQGVTDISNIKFAILEVSGSLSVLPYSAHCPSTHGAHELPCADNGLPIIVINDGRILSKNLQILGLDENWLNKELKNRGVQSPEQVFLFSVDENQNVYFSAKTQ